MGNKLLTGFWRTMVGVPPVLWEKQIEKARHKVKKSTRFISSEHRLVHHYVVRELPRVGEPITAERVARELALPPERVEDILQDLEKHLTFLVRDEQGRVVWAYPVTVEKTPHRITFGSGERLYAAWAVDAFATPFVQGRLRQEDVVIQVETECAHCKRPMQMVIDSDMNCRCQETDCRPIIFVPDVDFSRLKDPNIISAFWKESVFFRSEEHARAYRRKEHRIRGAYFTPDQVAYLNKAIQNAIFGWWISGREEPNGYHQRNPAGNIMEVKKVIMTHSIVEIKVRGFHVDAFGVVNHAWFIRFFEEARWAYLDERPALRNGLQSAGVAHSVVSLHVEYKLPVRLGNLLRIKTRVTWAGRRSITFEQEANITPGQETAVIAQVTNVFFRARGGEVVEVNDGVFDHWPELKDLYKSLSGRTKPIY